MAISKLELRSCQKVGPKGPWGTVQDRRVIAKGDWCLSCGHEPAFSQKKVFGILDSQGLAETLKPLCRGRHMQTISHAVLVALGAPWNLQRDGTPNYKLLFGKRNLSAKALGKFGSSVTNALAFICQLLTLRVGPPYSNKASRGTVGYTCPVVAVGRGVWSQHHGNKEEDQRRSSPSPPRFF